MNSSFTKGNLILLMVEIIVVSRLHKVLVSGHSTAYSVTVLIGLALVIALINLFGSKLIDSLKK